MLLVFLSSLALSASEDLPEPSCAAPVLLQASAQRALMEASNSSGKKAKHKGHRNNSAMPTYSDVDNNKDGVLTPKEFHKKEHEVASTSDDEDEEPTQAISPISKDLLKAPEPPVQITPNKANAVRKVAENLGDEVPNRKAWRTPVPNRTIKSPSESPAVPAPKLPSYSDIDMNKDGVLTPNEFQQKRIKVIAAIEKQVRKVIKHENKLEDLKLNLERQIDEMPAYEDLDKNRDGVLTPAEYSTSSTTAMAKNLSYKALDLDGDGAVTPDEFEIASEKWAAEMAKKVQETIAAIGKAREERRQLEQEIDRMQSYNDLDSVKRDGVVTPSEYIHEMNAVKGAWSVEGNASARGGIKPDLKAKAGASARGLGGLVGLVALVLLAQ